MDRISSFISIVMVMTGLLAQMTLEVTPQEREKKLRERWEAFLAENSKAMDFSNTTATVVNGIIGRDLVVPCTLNKPLRLPHTLSFIRLEDFSLLFVGLNRSIKDKRFQVLRHNDHQWGLQVPKHLRLNHTVKVGLIDSDWSYYHQTNDFITCA